MIDIKLFVSQLIFQHSQRQTAILIAKGCCRGTESPTRKYGKEEKTRKIADAMMKRHIRMVDPYKGSISIVCRDRPTLRRHRQTWT